VRAFKAAQGCCNNRVERGRIYGWWHKPQMRLGLGGWLLYVGLERGFFLRLTLAAMLNFAHTLAQLFAPLWLQRPPRGCRKLDQS
jgi:hypothetical protein